MRGVKPPRVGKTRQQIHGIFHPFTNYRCRTKSVSGKPPRVGMPDSKYTGYFIHSPIIGVAQKCEW